LFTVNLAERPRTLLVDHVEELRKSVRVVRKNHPFVALAWVVLSDHMHAIRELPEGDGDCATRWMLIKSGFLRGIPKMEWVRVSRRKKGEREGMATVIPETPDYRCWSNDDVGVRFAHPNLCGLDFPNNSAQIGWGEQS
jgi:putative transposase